jgi:hypothetical protein
MFEEFLISGLLVMQRIYDCPKNIKALNVIISLESQWQC